MTRAMSRTVRLVLANAPAWRLWNHANRKAIDEYRIHPFAQSHGHRRPCLRRRKAST